MKTNYEIRYAAHPEDAKNYDTKRIRRDFLIEKVFAADEVNMVYSMYDRMVVGGAMLLVILLIVFLGPLLSPYEYDEMMLGDFLAEPSWDHPFGLDNFSRDIFTRVLVGGQTSLWLCLQDTWIIMSV